MTHPDLRDDQLLHRLPALYLDQYILECGSQRIWELDQIVGRKLAIKRDLANIISLGRQCTLDLWVLPEAKRTDVDKPKRPKPFPWNGYRTCFACSCSNFWAV